MGQEAASVIRKLARRLAALPSSSESAACDLVGLGECSLDEVLVLPRQLAAGGKYSVARREELGGGQVATALVAAQRLGLRTAFLGAVGDDEAGRIVLRGLAEEGVEIGQVAIRSGRRTRGAAVLVSPSSDASAPAERTVIEWRDEGCTIDAALVLSETVAGLIAAAPVVHVDGVFPRAALAAASLAEASGSVVSIDLDHDGEGTADLLARADLCVVSASLASALFPHAPLARATERLAERTDGWVVVTCGSDGCYYLANDRAHQLPAFPVPALVDTTACGDTFHAALIAACLTAARRHGENGILDEEWLPRELLRAASAAAALKCRDLGRRGCPSAGEVTALLAAHPDPRAPARPPERAERTEP